MSSASIPLRPSDSLKEKAADESVVSTITPLNPADYSMESVLPPSLTPEQERKLYRKIDVRVMIILCLMYMLPFLDRAANGNAALTNFVGNQANISLMIFFVPYCLLDVPAFVAFKKFRPSKWLSGATVAWGVVMLLMAFSKTFQQATTGRFFLGIVDAAFPGILYYVTLWYPREKLQYRFGLLFILSTLGGATAGFLTWLVSLMDGTRGLETWAWLFIYEGIINIIIGAIAFYILVDSPSDAKWLSTEERAYLTWQKKYDYSAVGEAESFEWRYVWAAFTDWQVWLHTLTAFAVLTPLYGISLFEYTLVAEFGLKPSFTQLTVIPPYVLAAITFMIFSNMSDRIKMRSPFILAGMFTGIVGYAINISNASLGTKYFGIYLCVMGLYGALPGVLAWLASNLSGQCKRGTGMALQFGLGNFAGAIASLTYVVDASNPVLGHTVSLVFLGLGFVTVPTTVILYKRINAAKERELAEMGGKTYNSVREVYELGDKAIDFKYML